jgi:hypothetical protein
MKKIIMTVAVAISSLVALANEGNVNQKALDAFTQEFSSVTNVEWATGANYYRASFVYNNNHVFAYYSLDGEMLGLTRYMSSMDLPLNLQTGLKKKYSAYWISDLFEVSKNSDTAYYITLENADATVVLKSTGGSNWEVFKSTKKI